MAGGVRATTVKMASWILMVLFRFISRPLVRAVRNDQWVARRVGAGDLSDGAAPLHLQLREVAFPSGTGEEGGIDAAQRQVEYQGHVGVISAHPLVERLVGP